MKNFIHTFIFFAVIYLANYGLMQAIPEYSTMEPRLKGLLFLFSPFTLFVNVSIIVMEAIVIPFFDFIGSFI